MAITFSTATRKRARLRLGLMGASGSGKTYGAIRLALGIASKPENIFLIDTERHSAELYAHLGAFQTAGLEGNFDPSLYVQYIHAAEKAGAEVIVIDSLSHAWEGEGGALDQVDAAANRSKSGNSYTAWKDVTPKHRALVDAMLQSPCHIVATLRAKQEYVLEKDERTGKTSPRKIGLAPIQRAGMEYEFTAFLDINDSHIATASKDRTSLLDGKNFQIDEGLGSKLLEWLNTGAEPVAPAPNQPAAPAAPAAAQASKQEAAAAPALGETAKRLDAFISNATTLDELRATAAEIKEAVDLGDIIDKERAGLQAHYRNKKAKLEREAAEPKPAATDPQPAATAAA